MKPFSATSTTKWSIKWSVCNRIHRSFSGLGTMRTKRLWRKTGTAFRKSNWHRWRVIIESYTSKQWWRLSNRSIKVRIDPLLLLHPRTVSNQSKRIILPPIQTIPSMVRASLLMQRYLHSIASLGDVHFYGYQDDSWDPRTYPITRFLSETGIQSLPSLETWYQATDNATDLNLQSAFLRHREHSGGQIEAMMLVLHCFVLTVTYVDCDLDVIFEATCPRRWRMIHCRISLNGSIWVKSIKRWRWRVSVITVDCIPRPIWSIQRRAKGKIIGTRTMRFLQRLDCLTRNTMGLMYWQINDIWQAPTWSTIDYGLNWKMAHYYVRHMYASVYPLAVLTPYLANPLDEQARLSFYVINEFLDDSQGQLTCSVHTLDAFSVRASFSYDVSFDLLIMRLVIDLPYASLMQRTSCSNDTQCLVYCSYNDGQRETDQTLFLTKPKNYQLIQPNLRVERIEQQSSTHFSITLTATRPALFVWLEIPANVSGYFSKNGFHMFAPTTVVDFHSWTPINDVAIRLRSLFDVTQPWYESDCSNKDDLEHLILFVFRIQDWSSRWTKISSKDWSDSCIQ